MLVFSWLDMTNYQKYTELEVWKQARVLASYIYQITASFPVTEQYGIVSQMRRCAVSIPSNIAEGSGRQHEKETLHFLSISRGSLYELETQIYISNDLNFISEDICENCLNKIENLGKLINGFIRYYRSER